jgi:NAD(P)-dependent dehydrogenase (short-subunit alcohol dehydrogenase family)
VGHYVRSFDKNYGHDFTSDSVLSEIFKIKFDAIVNLFAFNAHQRAGGNLDNFRNYSLEKFASVLQLNVTTLFDVCRRYINSQPGGSIVNFASIYAIRSPRPKMFLPGEKDIAYGVSKAAVLQLSRHLATHSAPNFRVNTIILGGVDADQSAEFKYLYSENTPMGRMAFANEIWSTVDYLASDASSYVTGAEIRVDGGWSLW